MKAQFATPRATSETGGDLLWVYDGLTTDPDTRKVDTDIFVHLEDGRVTTVNF